MQTDAWRDPWASSSESQCGLYGPEEILVSLMSPLGHINIQDQGGGRGISGLVCDLKRLFGRMPADRQEGPLCAREMPTVGSPVSTTAWALGYRRLATWVPGLASWASQETVSEIVSNRDHVKSGGVPGRVGGWDPSESKSSWSRSLLLRTLTPNAEPGLLFHLAVPSSAGCTLARAPGRSWTRASWAAPLSPSWRGNTGSPPVSQPAPCPAHLGVGQTRSSLHSSTF